MPSPFPGMDPYLEAPGLWPDFHGAMLSAIRAALSRMLPPGYLARVDRYVWLTDGEGAQDTLLGKPDVFVANGGAHSPSVERGATAVLPAPMTVTLPSVRHEGQRYVQIVDQNEHRVVTVLGLLSPSNKQAGRDREAYLAKRDEYLVTGTNLVEIDLLREGARLPFTPALPAGTPYALLVSKAEDFPQAGVWPFGVRDPFPTCPVPLRPGVEPLQLTLGPCFERVYDEARFDAELDYSRPPQPPLPEPDAAWARELLAARLLPDSGNTR
jgi:hypothetical protein